MKKVIVVLVVLGAIFLPISGYAKEESYVSVCMDFFDDMETHYIPHILATSYFLDAYGNTCADAGKAPKVSETSLYSNCWEYERKIVIGRIIIDLQLKMLDAAIQVCTPSN